MSKLSIQTPWRRMRERALRPLKERSVGVLIFCATVAAALVGASPLFPYPFFGKLLLYAGMVAITICLFIFLAGPTARLLSKIAHWLRAKLEALLRKPIVNVLTFERILECLRYRASRDDLKSFLRGFCPSYIRMTPPNAIAEHYSLALELGKNAVQLRLRHRDGLYTLTVVTRNRPGLAAEVSGELTVRDTNIVSSVIVSNRADVAVGSFDFKSEDELSPLKIRQLLSGVHNRVSGFPPRRLMRSIHSPLRSAGAVQMYFQTQVYFDDTYSQNITRLKITARDRNGLYHDITSQLARSGCDIRAAFVETYGTKATDCFYLTKHGEKIDTDTQSQLEEALLKL